nr:retrovirus-related Pol polyprotein from transposon TNT 1-94 [Tanacetum cinerariifolium]
TLTTSKQRGCSRTLCNHDTPCVNLTTDVWSDPHGVPGSYMCVIAHWIEPDTWQMMKHVISFEELPSPHTGHALFKMLIKVLTNFNLKDKVMSITLDNASNNTSAIDKLKLKYDLPMRDFLIESISSDMEFFDDGFASKSKSYFKESLEGFWKEKKTMFPVLSRMTMDIISVQASSVASESAFSTSGRVLSIRRTRLTPASLEMCMCLNDHLDAKERKQDKCPLEIPLDFEEDVFDDEVQRNEAIPLCDEEIALDANASNEGTLSPGGPRIKIRALLKQQGIWAPIAGTKSDDMTDANYKLQEEKTHSTILLCLSDEFLYENVEMKIEDEDAALVPLVSLPPSFESFVSSFVIGKDTITLEDVRSSLHSRELRQASGSGYESQSTGLSTTSRDRGRN